MNLLKIYGPGTLVTCLGVQWSSPYLAYHSEMITVHVLLLWHLEATYTSSDAAVPNYLLTKTERLPALNGF